MTANEIKTEMEKLAEKHFYEIVNPGTINDDSFISKWFMDVNKKLEEAIEIKDGNEKPTQEQVESSVYYARLSTLIQYLIICRYLKANGCEWNEDFSKLI